MLSIQQPINPAVSLEARTEAALAHLAGAFFLFAGPLLVWTLKRVATPFGQKALTEAVNWQAYATLMVVIAFILLNSQTAGFLCILNVGFACYAAIVGSRGHEHRYPMPVRLLS